MSKQWVVETVKTEYPDLYLYNILEPNPDAGKSGVCYAGNYFSVASGLDSAENARLIAAAPEMYEALKGAVRELRSLNGRADGYQKRDTVAAHIISSIDDIFAKIEGV